MSSHPVSPHTKATFIMDPVDDGQEDGEGSDGGVPRAQGDEVDMDADGRQGVDGGEEVDRSGATEPPLPWEADLSGPRPLPRPRAKGVKHPAVPTKAQVERHALEQHVNYEAWSPHCAMASALVKQHSAASGESPDTPTVSCDFCFMKGREADPGDGIPVLVMRKPDTVVVLSRLRRQEHDA